MAPTVEAVFSSPTHSMAKAERLWITLVAGHGIEGDVHAGATVRHRFEARHRPAEPNLRQVHLLEAERLDELAGAGFAVTPGAVGENVLVRGVELVQLPLGARVRLGAEAVVELTGLRMPCSQLEGVDDGLMAAALDRVPGATPTPRIGVLGVVVASGDVRAGDAVAVELPADRAPLPVL
jgi:MOSC domain-containing protein YiiM